MNQILVLLALVTSTVGGAITRIFPAARLPQSVSLDSLQLSTASAQPSTVQPTSSIPGKVAGISTAIVQGGSSLARNLGTLVSSASGESSPPIDVQKISDQIGAQMERLPAQLVNQAKIAYCTQVLIEATKSAKPQ